MLIDVKRPSRRFLERLETRFALQQDNWNDYGFSTMYGLYFRHGQEETDVTFVGGVKILRRGQIAADPLLISEPFDRLGRDWVSVGTSLDYYQRLNEMPTARRNAIMTALRDAVARPELVEEFEGEKGWTTSLFRDNPDWREFLDDARALYQGNFGSLADVSEAFSYRPAGSATFINLAFAAPEPPGYLGSYRRLGPRRRRTLLPERMIVLIGRNGSGKSTLLSRLARVAFASPQERASKEMMRLGALDPMSIGFMRVITISYSAFDSFVVPGSAAKELSQATQDLESGEGRFVFCGLRDLAAEARADVRTDRERNDEGDDDDGAPIERRTSTRLKPVEALAREFANLIARIRKDEQAELLAAALKPLLADTSFAELSDQIGRLTGPTFSARSARSMFLGWSTGHKIALHVVASLVAHARPRSLILFDEPEAHLHPPLTAALMHAVRVVLAEVNAFCIAATHSPVLLQETLARHVRKVVRTGSSIEVTTPGLETFGENLGVLTYDAFGLTAASSDYHEILDLLVDGCDTPEEVDAAFTPGLSTQARAYVLSRFTRKG